MNNKALQKKIINEAIFIGLFALGVFYFIALVTHSNLENPFSGDIANNEVVHNSAGVIGAYLSDVFFSIFGLVAYLLPIAFIWFGVAFHNKIENFNKTVLFLRFLSFIVLFLFATAFCEIFPSPSGGWLGDTLHQFFYPLLGIVSYILYVFVILVTYAITSASSYNILFLKIKAIVSWSIRKLKNIKLPTKTNITNKKKRSIVKLKKKKTFPVRPIVLQNTQEKLLPDLDLLDKPSLVKIGYSASELEQMGVRVVSILADFGFQVEVSAINPGPVVTQFEISLAPGVKVSQIINLNKDLSRALLVDCVRIVDVVPGKPVIGIEIPNSQREMIILKEILDSREFTKSSSKLTLGLGKDINGTPIVADLTKMPHLLVAGATGMGKSVGLNAMILSILYKACPDDVRLIMIDPKIVELAIYANIPHLLTPVVTDMNEAASALWWCVNEMERRYQLMAKLGVRNLDGLNEKIIKAKKKAKPILDPDFNQAQALEGEQAPELETLPLIMVVIDEYADMLGALAQEDRSKSKRVEGFIVRLAQKARAAGVHLIIATQRPSVDVITGLIKSNIPTRIAFKVSSKVDSRTIIDTGGAEQLLGLGDMLYVTSGTPSAKRIHGAFVADAEIMRVVEFLKANYTTNYYSNIVNTNIVEESNIKSDTTGELDPLYDEAVEVVVSSGRASISSLQRRMRIGYNRAARIIEDMEAAGVVSSMNASGNRQVLAPKPINHNE